MSDLVGDSVQTFNLYTSNVHVNRALYFQSLLHAYFKSCALSSGERGPSGTRAWYAGPTVLPLPTYEDNSSCCLYKSPLSLCQLWKHISRPFRWSPDPSASKASPGLPATPPLSLPLVKVALLPQGWGRLDCRALDRFSSLLVCRGYLVPYAWSMAVSNAAACHTHWALPSVVGGPVALCRIEASEVEHPLAIIAQQMVHNAPLAKKAVLFALGAG
jgi:hypothetical protein